jgi:hypothetical protein
MVARKWSRLAFAVVSGCLGQSDRSSWQQQTCIVMTCAGYLLLVPCLSLLSALNMECTVASSFSSFDVQCHREVHDLQLELASIDDV